MEFFEDIAFGNVTDYSPDVYPVCDSAFVVRACQTGGSTASMAFKLGWSELAQGRMDAAVAYTPRRESV